MKPTVFGLLHFTVGYHQTPLDPASRHFTDFMAMGMYQWTRVAVGLKGAGPYFQRRRLEVYIDAVLTHGRDIETFLANMTP